MLLLISIVRNEYRRGVKLNRLINTLAGLAVVLIGNYAVCQPAIESTQMLGPLTGEGAPLHAANKSPHPINYYGTDLGFTYEHDGKIHFLFGDTWATEAYSPIEKSTGSRHDDSFGTVDLSAWSDPELITKKNIPSIKLGQNYGTSEVSAIDPGHAMDLGKTPMHGFSNGTREFGIFNIIKPQGCMVDGDCDNGLSCDKGLGYVGTHYFKEENLTLACLDGKTGCNTDTMVASKAAPVSDTGFCVDTGSTIRANTPAGRVAAVAVNQVIGLRSVDIPKYYTDIQRWLTNKFLNVTARPVADFAAARGAGHLNQDYRNTDGKNRRVFLWGRPGFVGVNTKGRTLGLYFAYVDMPAGSGFSWDVNYYIGLDKKGIPQFSLSEIDAQPLDLDSSRKGIHIDERYDIVNQMSVVWIDHLKKWVMFYGGGMGKLPTTALPDCGVLQLFAGYDCKDVVVGNGAVRLRTADDPWGPWSPPQDVIAGGDPDVPGSGQYGSGGALRHPACTKDGCAPHTETPFYNKNEYGFFYSANIIEQWIKPVGESVDVIWNVSTWDPYRVVLLKTRIKPN